MWWLLSRRDQEQTQSSMEVEIIVPSIEPGAKNAAVKSKDSPIEEPKTATRADQKAASSDKPDDLKQISGIGPKISSVLQSAGITTYAKLAETDPAELQRILRQAGINLAKPETWPEQARSAVSNNL